MDWQSHSLKKWKQSAKKSPNKQNPKLSLIDMQTMLFLLFLYFFKVLWCHSQAFYTFIQQVKEQTESKADTVNVVSITDQNKKTR